MRLEPNIAPVASLFGEPSRAAILTVLLDGRTLPAGEIARVAGLSASAASGHLGKLVEGGLLRLETEGRHRYYSLAGAAVADAVEALAQLSERPICLTQPKLSTAARELRHARRCYNHLAGELAVQVARTLEARDYLRRGEGKRYELGNAEGRRWFAAQGIDFDHLRSGRHGVARQCLDWTERRPHLAGPLGTALFRVWCDRGWLQMSVDQPRLMAVTLLGWRELHAQLGIERSNATATQASADSARPQIRAEMASTTSIPALR